MQTKLSEQALAEKEARQIKEGIEEETGDVEQAGQSQEEDEDLKNTQFPPQQYFVQLEPVEYKSAEEAKKMTFKDFVSNQIRKHLPSVFRGLVADWKAIENWKDLDYLKNAIGNEYVEAIGFIKAEPFEAYAGEGISFAQRGAFVPFS